MIFQTNDRVRVITRWSSWFGDVGTIAGVDGNMLRVEGIEPEPLWFLPEELTAEPAA